MKFFYITNVFDLHTFDNQTTALLKVLKFSLVFVGEINITTSLLMIQLKYALVHYANLNSSSINKPYLWAVEYVFFFFFFLNSRLLSKTL